MAGAQQTSTQDIAPKEFKQLRTPLATELGSFFGFEPVLNKRGRAVGFQQAEGGTSVFGDLTADAPTLGNGLDPTAFAEGLSPEEQAVVDSIFGNASGSPEAQAGQDFRRRTIEGDFLEVDPRTREALTRPILEAFEEARRGDLGAFTRAGQRVQESSPFFRTRALAERGLANALADAEVSLVERGRERQFETASQAEAQDAQRAATATQRLQAVALPRLVRDLGIERGLEEFNRRLSVLLNLFQTAAGATQPTGGTFGTSVSVLG